MKDSPTRINTAVVVELIEEAQNAELCRNLELSQAILAPVWDDISDDPDFSHFDPLRQAELLRLCGFFLSFYGHSKNRADFQLRGKNLLTRAIELFDLQGLAEQSAEAQVILAVCYWYSGEVEESEAILRVVEQAFKGNELHPIYLQIKVNRLLVMFWKGQFQPGIEIIEQIATPMELCSDLRLKTMFHNQAGILFNVLSRYESAVVHLNKAIRFAEKSNNKRFIAINLNNLAFSNKQLGRFEVAHELLDRAEEINIEMGDYGWFPHMLDTRALIYIDQGKPAEALTQSERSIAMFRQGEDYAGLVDSLWTKCRCLLRLNRLQEALRNFTEIQNIATERIGESAVVKYSDLFAAEVYCIQDTSLNPAVYGFKKFMIHKALRLAGGGIVEAAKILGLKNHQALSEMLNKQFPEIYGELGIKRRARRQDAKTSKTQPKKIVVRDISRIKSSRVSSLDGSTFYFSARIMRQFGITEESLVSISKTYNAKSGLNLLYSIDDEFFVGEVKQDKFSELLYIDIKGREVLLDELDVIGEPVGYCPLLSADTDDPQFESFSS